MTDLATHTSSAPGARRPDPPGTGPWPRAIEALNGRHHVAALTVLALMVIAHLAEHAAQAVQIWVLDQPVKAARGVLGEFFPWLVASEWMHYGYAVVMLFGLILLRPGFTGAARSWWTAALAIQVWHHLEHLILLVQKLSGDNLADRPVPTSLAQFFFPRFELHLFYNLVVTVPMVIAMHHYGRSRHAAPAKSDTAA